MCPLLVGIWLSVFLFPPLITTFFPGGPFFSPLPAPSFPVNFSVASPSHWFSLTLFSQLIQKSPPQKDLVTVFFFFSIFRKIFPPFLQAPLFSLLLWDQHANEGLPLLGIFPPPLITTVFPHPCLLCVSRAPLFSPA